MTGINYKYGFYRERLAGEKPQIPYDVSPPSRKNERAYDSYVKKSGTAEAVNLHIIYVRSFRLFCDLDKSAEEAFIMP